MPDIRKIPNRRKYSMCIEALLRTGKGEFTREEAIGIIDTYFEDEKKIEVSDESIKRYIEKCVRRQWLKKVNGHYELP